MDAAHITLENKLTVMEAVKKLVDNMESFMNGAINFGDFIRYRKNIWLRANENGIFKELEHVLDMLHQ